MIAGLSRLLPKIHSTRSTCFARIGIFHLFFWNNVCYQFTCRSNVRQYGMACSWNIPCFDAFVICFILRLLAYLPLAWMRSWQHMCHFCPDPDAIAIDVFSLTWSTTNLYYDLSPVSHVGRVVQKIVDHKVEIVLIAPLLTTHACYCCNSATLGRVSKSSALLRLVNNPRTVNLSRNLRRIACRLSGNISRIGAFQGKLQTPIWHHGDRQLSYTIGSISADGWYGVVLYLRHPWRTY